MGFGGKRVGCALGLVLALSTPSATAHDPTPFCLTFSEYSGQTAFVLTAGTAACFHASLPGATRVDYTLRGPGQIGQPAELWIWQDVGGSPGGVPFHCHAPLAPVFTCFSGGSAHFVAAKAPPGGGPYGFEFSACPMPPQFFVGPLAACR